MGVHFEDATVNVPGAAKSNHEGTLSIADGEIAFRERGADAAHPPLFSWRVPRLTDGSAGPLLRVIALLGATAIQVGPLNRLAMITLRGVEREHVERVLADNGLPPVVQALTLAAHELASLRSWGILFVLIGLSNTDSGLHAVTGFGMTVVGLWALFAGPRVAILAANGLLLLALAAQNMQLGGVGFWPIVLGLLGLRQLQRWAELRPLLRNPVHTVWLKAKLIAPLDESAIVPAGYPGRTIAFCLSVVSAAFGLLFTLPVLASMGRDLHGLICAVLGLGLALWYILVTVYPRAAARAARRVFPASGPIAVILFPIITGLCLLVLVAGLLPRPPIAK